MNRDHPDAWSRGKDTKKTSVVPIRNASIGIPRKPKRVGKDSAREPYASIKRPTEFKQKRKTRKSAMQRSKSRTRARRRAGEDETSDGADSEFRGSREQPVYTNKLKLNQATSDEPKRRSHDDEDDGDDDDRIKSARHVRVEIEDLLRELEAMRKENGILTHKLAERERKDRMGEDEKRRLHDRIKELESWQARLQLHLDSQGKDDENRSRFLQAEINKLLSDLEKKSKLVDQLMAENERHKAQSIPVERERDLQRQLDEMTTKAEINFRKFQDALHDLEVMKRTRVPKDREQDILCQLEDALKALRNRDRQIDELTRDKRELLLAKEDAEKRLDSLKSSLKNLERGNVGLAEKTDSLEDVIATLKLEMERLRMEKDETSKNRLKEQMKFGALEERSKGVLDTIRPLQELAREQDAHITDLQREVDAMRQALAEYQREMEKLRELVSDEERTMDKYQDIATAHRRLLDENARLLAILERRQVLDTKTLTDQSQMKMRLEQARNKLRSSQNRISQLEDWLDEIYQDKHFDVVLKTSTVNGARATARRSLSPTLTLPLVASSHSFGETRRQNGRRRFLNTDNKLGYLTNRF